MAVEIQRIVTDRDAENRSVFARDEPIPVESVLGIQMFNLWGSGDGLPDLVAGDNPGRVFEPFFPGPGGTRFLVVEFPPDDPKADAATLAAAEREQPGGIGGLYEVENPGMHVSDTIDYGFCVEGELYLELDGGAERHITPGTCVVQMGTRHAWRNRSGRPAKMVYFMVGAARK
jgi:hypothetical protein